MNLDTIPLTKKEEDRETMIKSVATLRQRFYQPVPVAMVTLRELAEAGLNRDWEKSKTLFSQCVGDLIAKSGNPIALDIPELFQKFQDSVNKLLGMLIQGPRLRAALVDYACSIPDRRKIKNKAEQLVKMWVDSWDSLQKISGDLVLTITGKYMAVPHVTYMALVISDMYIPVLKYQTNILFNKFWKVEKDNRPALPLKKMLASPRFFLSMEFSLFLMRKLDCSKLKNQIIFNTIFQGFKRALDPLSPMRVEDAVQDHWKNLTKDPSKLTESRRERIRSYIEELVNGSEWIQYSNWERQGALSTNGSFDLGRKDFGSLAELMEKLGMEETLDAWLRYSSDVTVFDDNGKGLKVHQLRMVSDEQLEDLWDIYVREHMVDQTTGAVRPAFILEPMKVRTITKGDTFTSSFLSRIQLWLHRNLCRSAGGVFSYLKETVEESPDNLQELLGLACCTTGQVVSGDFKGATDTVSMEYSDFVFTTLMDHALNSLTGFDPSVKDREKLRWSLAKRSLLGNRVVLDKSSYPIHPLVKSFDRRVWTMKDESVEYLQTNGQLMGSIISFPILCLVNFFCYRLALEEDFGRPIEDWNRHMNEFPSHKCLIVGDDIIFGCNDTLYDKWVTEVNAAGFVLSQGKNYKSGYFGLFCSKLYGLSVFRDAEPPSCHWKNRPLGWNHLYVPYANLGLIYDRSKTAHDPLDLRSLDKMNVDDPVSWKSRAESIPPGLFCGRFFLVFLAEHIMKRSVLYPQFSDVPFVRFLGAVVPRRVYPSWLGSLVRFASKAKIHILVNMEDVPLKEWDSKVRNNLEEWSSVAFALSTLSGIRLDRSPPIGKNIISCVQK